MIAGEDVYLECHSPLNPQGNPDEACEEVIVTAGPKAGTRLSAWMPRAWHEGLTFAPPFSLAKVAAAMLRYGFGHHGFGPAWSKGLCCIINA